MATKYFTQLTQMAAGSVASGDALAIEDISAGETKYITASDVATYVSSTLAGSSGGWDAVSDTWTYLGAGTVAIPAGGTLLYGKGDKIKFVQGGTQLYFYATEVGGTTLVLTGGSDYTLGTAAISSVYYSKADNPLAFPDWFNYTPAWTSTTGTPAIVDGTLSGKFKVAGKAVTAYIEMVCGASTTYGTAGGEFNWSLPVVSATAKKTLGAMVAFDNNTNTFFSCIALQKDTGKIRGSANAAGFIVTTVPMTWAANDYMSTTIIYQMA